MSNAGFLPQIPKTGDQELDDLFLQRTQLTQKVDTLKQMFNVSFSMLTQEQVRTFLIDLANVEIEGLERTLDYLKQNKKYLESFLI
jgi:Arc/MetJ family transcription regulator